MEESAMKTTSFYPVLMTNHVAQTAAFYITHFGFEPVFEADWYVHLQSSSDTSVNLAVLDGAHQTIPVSGRGTAMGLLLNFEVQDATTEFARLNAEGLPMLLDLRDEAFGQRHFITADPDGVMIDVIEPIEPFGEFATNYPQEAEATDRHQH
jgi:catechol 2,3-dioxygenase-like lactoylglutathione lyase family enzyme